MKAKIAKTPGKCPRCIDPINPGSIVVTTGPKWTVHLRCACDAALRANDPIPYPVFQDGATA